MKNNIGIPLILDLTQKNYNLGYIVAIEDISKWFNNLSGEAYKDDNFEGAKTYKTLSKELKIIYNDYMAEYDKAYQEELS